MKFDIKILKNFGYYSYAAFIIAVVSGVILALAFDINNPYSSLSSDFINNRPALFARSVHYWSANIFMIFSVLHIIDHIFRNTFREIKKGVWLRLSLLIIAILYVMLSGFLLRADAETMQARMILDGLLQSIPLVGETLSLILLGSEDNLIIIYVHHIATATILIWLASIEHSKLFQASFKHYLKIVPISLFLGFLFIPYIHNPENLITKSPWYFLAMQEILHWMNYPLIIVILSAFFVFLLYYLIKVKEKNLKLLKRTLFALTVLYVFIGIFAFAFRGKAWEYADPFSKESGLSWGFRPIAELFYTIEDTVSQIPMVRGHIETCLVCHSDMQGFSKSHDPQSLGCSSCHLGDHMALNKDLAHKGMILVPGNIKHAEQTCGQSGCHTQISQDIHKSIMATMSGVVSVNKWVFGEATNPDSLCNIMEIGHSESEIHLRNLCASCHLQGEKIHPEPISELSRGGGCTACHIEYKGDSWSHWIDYEESGKKDFPKMHPELNINITNKRCFGCHSRSGRLSTHYEGWLETMLEEDEIPEGMKHRILEDGRVFKYIKPDVHHELGLQCTDCHSSYEVMGDGNVYAHKEQQVKIQCEDCHNKEYNNTVKGTDLDYISARIAELKGTYDPDRLYITTKKGRFALVNSFVSKDGSASLILKKSGDTLKMKAPSDKCGRDIPGHSRLSCQSCHNSWATTCVGCHNYYDDEAPGWDNLKGKEVKGAWIEEPGNIEALAPTLGIVKEETGHERIINFVPGMVLTIDQKMPESHRNFMRLYAPAFSHTITKESRTCKSCHNDPFAIGYGRGILEYKEKEDNKYYWSYKNYYSRNVHDMLPEDAWIDFLKASPSSSATRTNVRPFSIEEQKKILTIGACFSCHKENDKKVLDLLKSEKNYQDKISDKCILPMYSNNESK